MQICTMFIQNGIYAEQCEHWTLRQYTYVGFVLDAMAISCQPLHFPFKHAMDHNIWDFLMF